MASSSLPDPIQNLIAGLSKLPGIGPRSAERIALHLVQTPQDWVQQLSSLLLEARLKISLCQNCGALTETQPCLLCQDPRRNSRLLCLVEKPLDIFSIEKTGTFKGRYHVLGGKISPLNGIGPEDLRIRELGQRIPVESIGEIIVALGTDVEGDATSAYIAKQFSAQGLVVSRIAHGIPVGTGLEFADEVTLSRALQGRQPYPTSPH